MVKKISKNQSDNVARYFKLIRRANDRNRFLSVKARKVLVNLIDLIEKNKNKSAFINHKFLFGITEVKSCRQNVNILSELAEIFEYKFYKSFDFFGVQKSYGYFVTFSSNAKVILEDPESFYNKGCKEEGAEIATEIGAEIGGEIFSEIIEEISASISSPQKMGEERKFFCGEAEIFFNHIYRLTNLLTKIISLSKLKHRERDIISLKPDSIKSYFTIAENITESFEKIESEEKAQGSLLTSSLSLACASQIQSQVATCLITEIGKEEEKAAVTENPHVIRCNIFHLVTQDMKHRQLEAHDIFINKSRLITDQEKERLIDDLMKHRNHIDIDKKIIEIDTPSHEYKAYFDRYFAPSFSKICDELGYSFALKSLNAAELKTARIDREKEIRNLEALGEE